MSLFGPIDVSGTGVDAMQTWIDTSAGNIANANDAVPVGTPAYAAETPVFTPVGGGVPGQPGEGVATSVVLGSSTGVVAYDPSSPVANPQGEVVLPDVSMSDQLVSLIEAQLGYQADTTAIARAVAAYNAGLTIGS